MGGILPVSDFDNPHIKRNMQYSKKFKVTGIIGLFVIVVLGIFSLAHSEVYRGYLPSSSAAGSPGLDKSPSTGGVKSTTECTRSYDGKKPINQYVIMIDAGSSGSRVHVYKFNNCGPTPQLVDEVFEMLEPGLSAYAGQPEKAAASLDSLLAVALKSVPKEAQACSPIAVKATAGLRKLGDEGSAQILAGVRKHLEESYPFPVVEGDGVSIMSGDDEGVYAWVTANFLLGKIGGPSKTPTVAVFDLGGGSTQIVFEPTFKDPKRVLADGDHRYVLRFGGREFVLYQHSYLGYGLHEARDKMNNEIVRGQAGQQTGQRKSYRSPCLPPNTSVKVKTKVPDGTTSRDGETYVDAEVTFEGPETAAPLQCRAIAEKVLDKDAACTVKPCSFGGIHQPSFYEAFPMDSDMYVFSFFYDRMAPLGMPHSFTLHELRELTQLVCQGKVAYSAFESVKGAVNELESNPQWCAELSYMDALLRTGYEIKGHREVKIANKIDGNEIGWALGASLPLLDQVNWKCRG